jgi:DNA-binding transcriptional ArsR family regulator
MIHRVQIFHVLADPVRRRIVEYLADGEFSSGSVTTTIRNEFGISQPAVSQHLKVLRDNGFTRVRIDGSRRIYKINPSPLKEFDLWLDKFRHFWESKLDDLAEEIERGKRERVNNKS